MKPSLRLLHFMTQTWSDFPERVALHYKRNGEWATMSYATLLAQAKAYGEYLTSLGVVFGEKVVLFPENTPDRIAALLGIMYAEAVPCLVDGQLPAEVLQEQLKALQPRVVVGDECARLEGEPSVLSEEVALVLLTSGTSGAYQQVCHSHSGIILQIQRSVSVLPELSLYLKNMFFLPYFHIYPLANHLLPSLAYGGECLLVTEINRRALVEGMRKIKPALLIVVPRILEVMRQGIQEKIEMLPWWKKLAMRVFKVGGQLQAIFCGGAALDTETQQFIERVLAPVYVGYGLTETAGACVSNTRGASRPGTVGRALPGCAFKIDQPDAQGEGEICIQSDAMMLGYLQNGKVVPALDADGWYRTGDLGRVDHEGYLTITDRIKDLIVTSDGKKVSPLMLEKQYKHIPHVRELMVMGIQEASTNAQKVVALVVPTDTFHKEMIETALFEKASQLPHQYRLHGVFFVKEILKTNTMKVHRNKNREALLQVMQAAVVTQTLAASKEILSADTWAILAQLVSVVGQVLNRSKDQIDVTKNLVQMGMDSIEFADFYLLLPEEYRTKLPLEKIYALPLITLAEQMLRGEGVSVRPLKPDLDKNALNIEGLPVVRAPAQTILLTGATGFLGAFVLRDLMLCTQAHVVCIVRAPHDDVARIRVIENAKKYRVWDTHYGDRLKVIAGDLAKPMFGLSPAIYDTLSEQVDSTIHVAANVNFLISYDALYEDNVAAVEILLRFSAHKRLKVLEHVSTFSVLFGEPDVFPASSLGYTQSKWAAEQLLYQVKALGLPVNIYRPAIITGDTVNGLYNENDLFINMFLNCLQLRKYIHTDAPVYMVPVDIVSAAIVRLAGRGNVGQIYHLFGGASPILFSSLMSLVSQRCMRLSPVSREDWFASVIAAIKAGKGSALHRYLPLFMSDPTRRFLNDLMYLGEKSLSASDTNAILLEEGLDMSDLTEKVVTRLMEMINV